MAKATRRSQNRARPVSKSARRSQNRGRPASKSRSTSRSRRRSHGRSRGPSNKKRRRSKKVGGSNAGNAGSNNVADMRDVEEALSAQEKQKQELLTLLQNKAREKGVTIPTDGNIDEQIKTLLTELVKKNITYKEFPKIIDLLQNPSLSSLRQTTEVKKFLGEASSDL